jgi:hypothetical protein
VSSVPNRIKTAICRVERRGDGYFGEHRKISGVPLTNPTFQIGTTFQNARKALAPLSIAAFILFSASHLIGCSESTSEPTTDPNALITLTDPKGGETFKVGQTIYVKWTTKVDAPDPVDNVDVMFSADGVNFGYALANSIEMASPKWGNAAWTIPESLTVTVGVNQVKVSTVSATAKIRVRHYSTSDAMKISTSAALTITRN